MVSVASGHGGRIPSVVIVAYNSLLHLRRCLPPLQKEVSDRGGEIILVDNGSADGTQHSIPVEFPWVRLIVNGMNRGYAAGVNQGLHASTGDLVLVLNPDVIVRPGAIPLLVEFMRANPQAGIVGPRLLNPDGRHQPSCRRFHTLSSMLSRRGPLRPFLRGTRWETCHLMLGEDFGTSLEVDWILGACMLVRRRAIQDVGPMDEGFFLYFEDEDWCYRMWERGWAVCYVPAAVATHEYRRESDHLLRPAYRRFVVSAIRLIWKYGLFMKRPVAPRPQTAKV